MSTEWQLQAPYALLLLPLALLPLATLRQRAPTGVRHGGGGMAGRLSGATPRDAGRLHPSIVALPTDAFGRLAEHVWRTLAASTLLALVIALARPGLAETEVPRIARGAELSILLDRSSSMDATIRRGPPVPGEGPRETVNKNTVVREALLRLIEERPDNRYALTLFNAAPLRVAPFLDDPAAVQAGLVASGIGRGPSQTDMGRAMLAAIDAFDGREYVGSRAILLVSDGGARLDEATQRAISAGLSRERIALYFVYVRSSPNSPQLETVSTVADTSVEEVALHVFFDGLDTDYRVYEAEDPESMARVVDAIDAQQSLPLARTERVPGVDRTSLAIVVALLGTLMLLALSLLRRREIE